MPASYCPQGPHETFTLTMVTPLVKEPGTTTDYNDLINKPTVNGVEITGDLTLDDLGIQAAGDYPSEPISDEDLNEILI